MIDINISDNPLDPAACIEKVSDSGCGGLNLFIGTIRDTTRGKKVIRLKYEAYPSMAKKEMRKIAEEAMRRWPIHHILMHHRTGALQVGDIAVIIATHAAHREAAFMACRYAIDTLKKTVPIWKKEIFEDGEEWVSDHA